MENNYISNQITKYQTNKKLIAFTDKLVLATVEQYATIPIKNRSEFVRL